MSSTTPTYKNHRFPIDIVARAVWLYFRFNVSLREVEEMMLERFTDYLNRFGVHERSDVVRSLRIWGTVLSDLTAQSMLQQIGQELSRAFALRILEKLLRQRLFYDHALGFATQPIKRRLVQSFFIWRGPTPS